MGTFCVEVYLHCVRRLLALQALFLLRRLLPLAKLLLEFRFLGLLLLLLPPLRRAGRQEGSQGAPGVLSGGGLPSLPLDLGRARGVEVPLGFRLGRAGTLPLLLLLRERAKWELPARCRLPFPAVKLRCSPQFSLHVPRRENSRETS